MSTNIIPLRRFPKRVTGTLGDDFHFVAHVKPSAKTQRHCSMCNRKVRRSWRTGILHARCRRCRYLVMMYGPSIEVEQVDED